MSTLTIDLPPALEQFIQDQLRQGYYTDAAELVRDALRRFAVEDGPEARFAVLREAIRPGLEQADRGEVFPLNLDEFLAELHAERRARSDVF